MGDEVIYERMGRVAVLSFNRPERRNSVNRGAALKFADFLKQAADDQELAVLVIRGTGCDFCAGGDVKPADPDKDTVVDEPGPIDLSAYMTTLQLHTVPAVTVAAIRGACAGAGLSWALACDFRVADTTARFNTAFLDVGVAGDMGGPWLMSRVLGGATARELFFFPRKIEPAEALRLGLVSRVFEADAFESELDKMVGALTGAAPVALRGMKANFLDSETVDLNTFLALEGLRHKQIYASQDRMEAFRAYVEKRQPTFVGR